MVLSVSTDLTVMKKEAVSSVESRSKVVILVYFNEWWKWGEISETSISDVFVLFIHSHCQTRHSHKPVDTDTHCEAKRMKHGEKTLPELCL